MYICFCEHIPRAYVQPFAQKDVCSWYLLWFSMLDLIGSHDMLADCEASNWMEGAGGHSAAAAAPVNQWMHDMSRLYQYYLDKTTPHATYRWVGAIVAVAIYALRVYYVQGFFIVSYGLGIYLLNLFIGFLSPLVDPEMGGVSDGPLLPTKGSDEFKPFIRRLPEFKFW